MDENSIILCWTGLLFGIAHSILPRWMDDNLAIVIMQLAARPDSPVSLQQLVEIARTTSSNSGQGGTGSNKEDKIRLAKDKKVLFPHL